MKDVMMVQTAKRVVALLTNIGIPVESDFKIRLISDTLRGSWYVNELLYLGYEKCVYINLHSNGFLVILDDYSIASGQNIMILTAFENLAIELMGDGADLWYELIWDNPYWEAYNDDEEDGLIICRNTDSFVSFLDYLLEHQ